MRIPNASLFIAASILGGSAWAAGIPLGETASPFPYALDTEGPNRAIKSDADLNALWEARCLVGETITYVRPDGTAGTLVADAWSETTAALPINGGGLWTFANSVEGTATFTVRHSLFGTQGAGTAASPAKIVDAAELIESGAGVGYVFTLDGSDGLLAELQIPDGFQLAVAGDNLWRIVRAVPGWLAECLPIDYWLDSEAEGPNRRTRSSDTLPITYTGDNWSLRAPAASTLTLVSPSGVTSVRNLAGTGVEPMRLREPGLWQVTLAYAGTTLASEITVIADATTLLLR